MQLMNLRIFILIAFQFYLSSTLLPTYCRTSNDRKNYTCSGFRFRQLTSFGSRSAREKFLRVRIYDCKETELPEHTLNFPSVENLTVSCGIVNIHKNAIKNLPRLLELDLGNNTLSEIPDHLFESAGEMRTLNLSRNNFERLTQNMFEGLHNLKELLLSFNKISDFHLKVFDKIQQVEAIYLDNNDIAFLPSRLFQKLQRVDQINLSYNKIATLTDIFKPINTLSNLNLSNNVIEDLPARIFQSTHLKVIDLSHNKLIAIYEDALQLDFLQEFYLQNNNIKYLEVGNPGIPKISLQILDLRNNLLVFVNNDLFKVASNLVSLHIEGNPWDCKCLEKLHEIRYNISLETYINDESGEQPICVSGNPNECNVNRNNLTFYYDTFKKARDE